MDLSQIGQCLKKMSDQRKNDEIPCLENIGSCGLHIVSNPLQNGAKKKKKKRLEIRQNVKINVEIFSGLSCLKRYICQGK